MAHFGMKSSFCSFVPSHSPAVSLLSNKVHSECHNATDPFLDWYLFICLFISESLLFDFTPIPCFLLCCRTASCPCPFFFLTFLYKLHSWLYLAVIWFGLFLLRLTSSVACTSQYGCCFTVVDCWPWGKMELELVEVLEGKKGGGHQQFWFFFFYVPLWKGQISLAQWEFWGAVLFSLSSFFLFICSFV